MNSTPRVAPRRECLVDDCTLVHYGKGYCRNHFYRWKTYGDPLAGRMVRNRKSFWANVDKSGPGECWLWTGRTNEQGYGRFSLGFRDVMAHRMAYLLLVGPLPDGIVLDHVKARGCTNTGCVRVIADENGPAHLEPVTSRENTLRGDGPTAVNARKTHCIRGHEFTPENTRYLFAGHGLRACKECHRLTHTPEYIAMIKDRAHRRVPQLVGGGRGAE